MKKSSTLKFLIISTSVSFLVIIFALIFFWQPKPELELTVSVFDGQFCALIFYAEHLNLFNEERLKVDYSYFDAGINSVDDLLAGNADLATAAEFVAVNYIWLNPELRILSTIATGDVNSIIYKKDVDLASPDKKRIGITLESQADFFFQRFLVYNDLSQESFEVIDTNPSDMLEELKQEQLDGVVVWEPFVNKIIMALKEEVTHESVQAGQDLYFLLFSKESIVEKKAEQIKRFLNALVKAQRYKEKNGDDFRAYLTEHFKMTDDQLERTIENVDFSVSLSQGLLQAMEAEARWCIKSGTCKDISLPNYLDYLVSKYLLEINPDKVFLYQ
ncbi:MAG: ABC transporter substrate-binding protein [Thermotogota bacterium]